MAVSQTITGRTYAKIETSFGTAATLAASNHMRHSSVAVQPLQGEIGDRDKTGSISATRGATGARGGTWSINWEARPNGAAGSKPDADPILEATFGQAGTVVASTSVTYSMAEAIKTFTLAHFRLPSTITQYLAHGCVVESLGFDFEQQANARFSAAGTCLWVLDSENFSATDTTGKGGLGAFPSEPASPVSNGSPVNGLTGTATIDGSTALQVRSASIRVNTGIAVPNDRLFAGQYGSSPERDTLAVTLDLSIYDDDIAAVDTLKTKALARTPIDIVLEAGSGAGTRIQWTLNDCLLPIPSLTDDARKWALNLSGIRAYPTSLTSLDEVSVKFY